MICCLWIIGDEDVFTPLVPAILQVAEVNVVIAISLVLPHSIQRPVISEGQGGVGLIGAAQIIINGVSFRLLPGLPSVGGAGQVDVVVARSIVLPDSIQSATYSQSWGALIGRGCNWILVNANILAPASPSIQRTGKVNVLVVDLPIPAILPNSIQDVSFAIDQHRRRLTGRIGNDRRSTRRRVDQVINHLIGPMIKSRDAIYVVNGFGHGIGPAQPKYSIWMGDVQVGETVLEVLIGGLPGI